eukprot:1139547-Pelagomonas_calceolata.AAC.5
MKGEECSNIMNEPLPNCNTIALHIHKCKGNMSHTASGTSTSRRATPPSMTAWCAKKSSKPRALQARSGTPQPPVRVHQTSCTDKFRTACRSCSRLKCRRSSASNDALSVFSTIK